MSKATTDGARPLTGSEIAEEALKRARARKAAANHPARTDFSAFCGHILRAKDGSSLPDSSYSRLLSRTLVWCMDNGMHLAHMAPPSIGKSTTVRPFLTWCLGNDPTLATVVISAEQKVAQRHVGLCRRFLLQREFREVFPEVRPDITKGVNKTEDAATEDAQGWRMNEFFLRNNAQSTDPAMAADAADPKSEARRVDILFADDVMSRRVANSKAECDRMKDAFLKTWLDGRLAGNGLAIVTHNCWNKDDLIHTLLSDTRFAHLWVGVDDECERMFVRVWNAPDDFPLFACPKDFEAEEVSPRDEAQREFLVPLPSGRYSSKQIRGKAVVQETWTKDWLLSKKLNAPVTFRGLYGLRAMAPEDLIFPAWERRTRVEKTAGELLGLREASGKYVANDLNRARNTFSLSIDLSSDKRPGTVLWLLAHTHTRHVVPIELHEGRFDDLKLVDIIDDIWGRGFHFREVIIETNALQDRVLKTIRRVAQSRNLPWWGRVVSFVTGGNKSHPEHGLPGINTMLHTEQIVWPELEARGTRPAATQWQAFSGAMATLTIADANDETPDSIMAFWFGVERLLKLGPAGAPTDSPKSIPADGGGAGGRSPYSAF